jgi:hypothetical protein
MLIVNVNGSALAVPMGATIFDAVQIAGVENADSVLAMLTVTRPFRGRPTPVQFDQKSREILAVQLIGGEQISWRGPSRVKGH